MQQGKWAGKVRKLTEPEAEVEAALFPDHQLGLELRNGHQVVGNLPVNRHGPGRAAVSTSLKCFQHSDFITHRFRTLN